MSKRFASELLAVFVVFGAAVAWSAVRYVDPTGGTVSSDDYDGLAETWQGGLVGPKETLAGVMADAKANDTVIAMPGLYKQKVSNPEDKGTGATLSRVIVPAKVTLKSRDGADTTYIVGEASVAETHDENGCGPDAVRCATVNGRLEGFTLCGGRTSNEGAEAVKSGGAAAGSGMIVDCIVSNNFAAAKGGGCYYVTLHRCRFLEGNDCATAKGRSTIGESWYDSYFCTKPYQGKAYGCTFAKGAFPYGCGEVCNSLLAGGSSGAEGNTKLFSCILGGAADQVAMTDCLVTNSAALALGADGRLGFGSAAIDRANESLFRTKVAAEWQDLDADRKPRIQNGRLDFGAFEYDWCAGYSRLLSPDGAVAVTNASAGVLSSPTGVVLSAGAAMAATLKPFDGKPSTYEINMSVTGGGTLCVYLGDASVPAYEITAVDGAIRRQFPVEDETACRFVYTGDDGHADLRDFSNVTRFSIEAAQKGLAILGAGVEMGTNYVAAGGSVTFSVKRAYDSTVACLGVTVNGVFFSLDDNPDGIELTVSDADRTSAVAVVAVYREGLQNWYVDDDGSDDNCGLYTNHAFKTLWKALLDNPLLQEDEVVYVLPGVYDEKECTDAEGKKARAYLKKGRVLKSLEGPERTIICGASSTDPEANANGCGTGAVRCLYLGKNTRVEGFTLTGGRVEEFSSGTGPESGGGAAYCLANSLIVDCILSNNVAYYGGAVIGGAAVLRCRFGANGGTGTRGMDAYKGTRLVDCHFANVSSYNLYSGCTAVNCTFDRGGGVGPRACELYNSLFLNGSFISNCDSTFDHCQMRVVPGGTSTCTDCLVTNQASLAIDSSFRPVKGATTIDAGSWQSRVQNLGDDITPELASRDVLGGQRVYNGKIDVGAGEYDWRGDFGKTLAKKGVAVASASEGVMTNAVAGVDLATGEKIVIVPTLKTPGKVSFTVTAPDEGTVTVMQGETELIPEGGVYSFDGVVGENEVVSVAFAGEGVATVSGFDLPKFGILLLVR